MEEKETKSIMKLIEYGKEYGLLFELISFALMYVEAGQSIEDACEDALWEWIK